MVRQRHPKFLSGDLVEPEICWTPSLQDARFLGRKMGAFGIYVGVNDIGDFLVLCI